MGDVEAASVDDDKLDEDKDNGDDDDDDGCYMFESDHAALKGNTDYRNLLKTISLLEAQRIQAIKDVETLQAAQEEALSDPIKFVEKLQQGEKFEFPCQQEIASVPLIDWEKYRSNVDFTSFGVPRHMTRLKKQLDPEDSLPKESENVSLPPVATATVPYDDLNEITVVRGRVKTESKPATFNQLWTVEEQKRLEELLNVYPPEEVEAKRWHKIASALGNRTPQQVASRVQKYFIKLAKAGLPVPGRIPNVGAGNRKPNRHQRIQRLYYQPSTFLQAYTPPVYMSDDEDTRAHYDAVSEARFLQKYERPGDSSTSEDSEDEDIPLELRHSEEYLELQKLKSLRARKLQQKVSQVQHDGYKCDMCECEPIIGTRWHCLDCPEDEAVDFCDDCVDSNHETATHNSSHRLKAESRKVAMSGGVDQDYMKFLPGDSSYLDPNYMPAS